MRYVILRDDDTNALTPVECLERLYRPFLARGLPVHLSTIPEVRTDVRTPGGEKEGFLLGAKGNEPATLPIGSNAGLVAYLRANAGFRIVQHGCFHEPFEFDSHQRTEVVRRLVHGAERLSEAGLTVSSTFVAPHDKFSAVAFAEVARRFRVISTGWFEWRRLPPAWWPRYALKKLLRRPHWRAGRVHLLSHPGCLLSYTRDPREIPALVRQSIARRRLTVLVTHWWEYFRHGVPDEPFIRALHETAEYLASDPGLCVTSFEAIAERLRTPAPAARALSSSPAI